VNHWANQVPSRIFVSLGHRMGGDMVTSLVICASSGCTGHVLSTVSPPSAFHLRLVPIIYWSSPSVLPRQSPPRTLRSHRCLDILRTDPVRRASSGRIGSLSALVASKIGQLPRFHWVHWLDTVGNAAPLRAHWFLGKRLN
jgi:hypothetical protein